MNIYLFISMATKHGGVHSSSSHKSIPLSHSRETTRLLSFTDRRQNQSSGSLSSSPDRHILATSTPARRPHDTVKPPGDSSSPQSSGSEEDTLFRPLPTQNQPKLRPLPVLSPTYLPPPGGQQRASLPALPHHPPSLSHPLHPRHYSYNNTPLLHNTPATHQIISPHNSYSGLGGVPKVLSLPAVSSPHSVMPSPTSSPLPQILTRTLRGQEGERGGGDSKGNRSLKIFIGTWNMHEEKELPGNIEDFLLPLSQETAADVYVIGTQESTPNRSEWELLLQETLGLQYVMVHSAALGCVYLCVLLRRDLIWYCTDVQSTTYATRQFTAIKTKGSVAIKLSLFGSSFLFVTSHFSAGYSNVAERNADMNKTLNNLSFSGPKDRLLKPHFIFWFGDLNYRVELERETVDEAIQEGRFMSLLLNDQLTREILAGNTFNNFSEQPITFPPSYKFDVNSYSYDTSELVRIPSWTDRILFFAEPGKTVGGCGYDLCPSILTSDHRPVFGIFLTTLELTEDNDGIPTSYNREVYIKSLQKLRHQSRSVPNSPKVSLPPPSTNNTTTITGTNNNSRTNSSNTPTSSVCIIL